MEAVVEFEYTAEQNDELTLKVGDKITNVKEVEGGWCEGELNGKRGVFPENFVKLIKPQEVTAKLAEPKHEAPQRKSVRLLANKFKDSLPVGPQKKKEKQKRCKVLFEYTKENGDELDLAVGEIVEFYREVEDGWWEGSLNGKQGVFPSNFVEMLEDTASPDEGNLSSVDEKDKSADLDFKSIKGKKVLGVGLGNIFDKGPIRLSAAGDSAKQEEFPKAARQESTEPTSEDAVMRNKSNGNLPSSTEQAIVRYSYSAEQPDELSLVEGQVVRIIEKNLEDEGWWRGEVNGRVGIFPDNFVQLLPNEDVNKNKPMKLPTPPTVKAALPKLPEKTKDTPNDKIKSDPPQPIAGKKPQMPPPMVKKPVNQKSVETKPEPPILHHQTNSVKDKSLTKDNSVESHNSEGPVQFDDIEPSSQRLTHLTQGRARGPKKRPPSSALVLNDEQKDKSPEEVKINPPPTLEKQQSRLPDRPDRPVPVLPPKDLKHPTLQVEPSSVTPQPPSTGTSLRGREPPTSMPPVRPPEPTKGPPSNTAITQTMKLIEQLTQQLNELKANTVSKTVFKDLQVQHEKLKVEFENMKKNHALKIQDLTNEVDVEKKLRLTTQAEIEHVKKSLTGLNI